VTIGNRSSCLIKLERGHCHKKTFETLPEPADIILSGSSSAGD